MPLTLELYHKKDSVGRMIVDRDNFVVQFFPKVAQDDLSEIGATRDSFVRNFSPAFKRLSLNYQYASESSLHEIADHMCKADKDAPHWHIKLSKNIEFKDMEDILRHKDLWLKFISEECYLQLQDISRKYFTEQTYHPAKKDEEDYHNDKLFEFKKEKERLRDDKSSSAPEEKLDNLLSDLILSTVVLGALRKMEARQSSEEFSGNLMMAMLRASLCTDSPSEGSSDLMSRLPQQKRDSSDDKASSLDEPNSPSTALSILARLQAAAQQQLSILARLQAAAQQQLVSSNDEPDSPEESPTSPCSEVRISIAPSTIPSPSNPARDRDIGGQASPRVGLMSFLGGQPAQAEPARPQDEKATSKRSCIIS